MKYLKGILFAVLLMAGMLSGTCTGKVYAADNQVTNIDIEVVIREDGSAYVTQYWKGEFTEGTENYIPIRTGDIGISEFSVSDEEGAYTLVADWDIDAGFKAKVRKCGIVETKNGVELCFGITEYGHKEYAISYLVTDFIKGYRDYNGTNFMFINPNMSTFPTAGSIVIRMEDGTLLDASNAGIWAFGYEGSIEFQNGQVVACTEENLRGSNSMIVMLQLSKELLSPETKVDKTFEAVKNEAMEDSDYGHGGEDDGEKKAALILLGTIFGSAGLIVVAAVYSSAKRAEEIKKFADSAGYYSYVPNNGNIQVTHYLAQTFDVCKEEHLILSALMVSMMNQYAIELRSTVDVFGSEEEQIELRLLKEPEGEAERRLFYILSEAAGRTGILQEKELEDYAYENYEEIQKFITEVKKNGEKTFKQQGGFVKGAGNCIKHLSETGKRELAQVIGLKRYLEESARMSERDIWEANLWQEYMVYAALFGIADDVIEQLQALYPERTQILDDYYHHYIWCHGYYHNMHRSMDKAIEAARAEGGGGSSSLGGGGGFSGGGSGGGSR